MWEPLPEVRQSIPGRVRAVSVPGPVRKVLVWAEGGFHKIVYLKTARTSRLTRKPNRFDPEAGTIRADGTIFTLYGACGPDGRVYTPALRTEHPAGDRLEPDPKTDSLNVIGADGRVRQTIPEFHCGSEPWAVAGFDPAGEVLLVADPRGVRVFTFAPDPGREPARWQASGGRADRDALLAAILTAPDEDTPRLVYADWLEEHGDPDRAEFIRLQVRRGRRPASWDRNDPGLQADYGREVALEEQFGERWAAEFPPVRGVRWVPFFRGFPQVRVNNGATLAAAAEVVWAASPVELVILTGFNQVGIRRLVDSPYFPRIRHLLLSWYEPARHGLAPLQVLLDGPALGQLRKLELSGCGNEGMDEVARLIARSRRLTGLEELDLGYRRLEERSALELAASPHLTALRRLSLSQLGLGPDTLATLRRRFPEQEW